MEFLCILYDTEPSCREGSDIYDDILPLKILFQNYFEKHLFPKKSGIQKSLFFFFLPFAESGENNISPQLLCT